jgi:proton-translocating NAD(P)+ transhydrogenase subunit alpha
MILGVLKETQDKRVALVPQVARKVKDLGIELKIESGAGEGAGYTDSDYQDSATFVSRDEIYSTADMIVVILKPGPAELDKFRKGSYVVSSFTPFADDEIIGNLKTRGLNAFSMDMIPRTSIAQSMDVLSSMASIAGYRAVVIAALRLVKYFPMMITAAGSIKPAKILVIGAGVAGLQAIATARKLGAVVEAFDTRTAVKEEIESLGARFVEVEGATDDKDAGGYAVQQTEEYMTRQRALVAEKGSQADAIICTAQVRGRTAPVIITAETVEQMKRGSVIVDLAASTGGNCELTENDKTIEHNGVTIIGDSDLAAGMPQDASFLFGNNFFNFLKYIVKDGELALDMEDEIVKSTLITL